MRILLDTNILIRIADQKAEHHQIACKAVHALEQNGIKACLVPQILYEYWVVATRPLDQNGLGMTPAWAEMALDRWLELFPLFPDERHLFLAWRRLVVACEVRGKAGHDARLVAAMTCHGLKRLLTFNDADFSRYSDIEVWTPSDVVSRASRNS